MSENCSLNSDASWAGLLRPFELVFILSIQQLWKEAEYDLITLCKSKSVSPCYIMLLGIEMRLFLLRKTFKIFSIFYKLKTNEQLLVFT